MRSRPLLALLAALVTALPACASPAPAASGDAGTAAADGAPIGGAVVRVHLRADASPVAHDPATSGQQPRLFESGIRSLTLYRGASDPAPVLVFDHGDAPVIASYADGADTIVATVPVATLTEGRFTRARVVHSLTRFVLDATLHYAGSALPGTLEETIALADGVPIDGAPRARGWYRVVFESAGMRFPSEGSGLEPPDLSTAAFEVRVEDGQTAYYFAIDLEVARDERDHDLYFDVAVHEPVRWIDHDEPGFAAGVLDVTPTSHEPIVQFGASAYALSIE